MDPRKLKKYGIGCIVADCVFLLEMIIGIYKGDITASDIYLPLALSSVLAIPIIVWIKTRKRQKE